MRSLTLRALIVPLLLAAASSEARAVPSLLGDANGDGRLTSADTALLNDMIYARRRIPRERFRAMDLDGNGFVDIDDLVDLTMIVRGDESVRRREVSTTGNPPVLIPRYAENWWTPREQKLNRALDERMTTLTRMEGLSSDNPNNEFSRQLDRTLQDLRHLNYYGALSEADLSRYCSQLETMRTNWFGSARQIYVAGAGTAVGANYLSACASGWTGGERTFSGTSRSPVCTDAAGGRHVFGTKYNYGVSRGSNGRLRLRMPIHIDASALTGTARAEFDRAWASATACVRDYWARYNVEFDIDVQSSRPSSTDTLVIHNRVDRADSSNFYTNDWRSGADFCSLLAHELGHRLSLGDEYPESGMTCPGRGGHEADALMNNDDDSIANLRWYPRNLQKIFGGACGPYTP